VKSFNFIRNFHRCQLQRLVRDFRENSVVRESPENRTKQIALPTSSNFVSFNHDKCIKLRNWHFCAHRAAEVPRSRPHLRDRDRPPLSVHLNDFWLEDSTLFSSSGIIEFRELRKISVSLLPPVLPLATLDDTVPFHGVKPKIVQVNTQPFSSRYRSRTRFVP
jgi:hypothetical protein